MSESQTTPDGSVPNTDREIWRASESYYAPSIHVTERGWIGIDVGGHVIVMPIEAWHSLGKSHLQEHS